MCKARLDIENERFLTAKLELVGDPMMIAGQVVMLGADFGIYAGRWLVQASTHRMDARGYTTGLTLRGIADNG